MKYLKRFNESVDESNIDDIKQTIKDILLPISDMGYEISITEDPTYFTQTGKFYIRVVTYTDTPLKMNDEIKDEFIRMKEYLESLGINSVKALYVKEPTPSSQIEVDFNEFINMDCELRNLLFVKKFNKLLRDFLPFNDFSHEMLSH